MNRKVALVCDDHGSRVTEWAATVGDSLGDTWEVHSIGGSSLADLVSALGEVEEASRANKSLSEAILSASQVEVLKLLDRARLVILDSDLTPNLEDARAMGEESKRTLRNQMGDTVARQMRSYSSVGFIVVVNMFWGSYPADRVFDLTMMQGWRSFADLHLSEAELYDPHLWTGDVVDGYHPWNWPSLATADQWIDASENAIHDLDAQVLEQLGLDITRFSPRQRDLFGDGVGVTFADLTTSELGFRYPKGYHTNEQKVRMAASVLRRWLTRTLLPGQNVIADAPHVLTRFSPILGDEENSEEAWQRVCNRRATLDADLAKLSPALSEGALPFTDRPVFSIDKVREVLDSMEELYMDPPAVAFAEDASRFVDRDSARGYQSDLPGPYSRRLVRVWEGEAEYEPSTRILT